MTIRHDQHLDKLQGKDPGFHWLVTHSTPGQQTHLESWKTQSSLCNAARKRFPLGVVNPANCRLSEGKRWQEQEACSKEGETGEKEEALG